MVIVIILIAVGVFAIICAGLDSNKMNDTSSDYAPYAKKKTYRTESARRGNHTYQVRAETSGRRGENDLDEFPIRGWRYRDRKTVNFLYNLLDLPRKELESHRIYLLPEPENEHDRNAIKIITEQGMHIGYFPKEYAEGILAFMRNKTIVTGYISSAFEGDYGTTFMITTQSYSYDDRGEYMKELDRIKKL